MIWQFMAAAYRAALTALVSNMLMCLVKTIIAMYA